HADRFRAAARAGRMLRARETFESSLRRIAEELDFHGNGHLGIEPRSEPGRTQARGIRDAVGVEGRAAPRGGALERLSSDVSRSDHEREAQLGLAVLEAGQPLRVGDAHGGFLARRDVADLQREDIVALLLQQRGALSRRQRFGIVAPRLFALLHLAHHRAASDAHLEAAHRGCAAERKDVGGFQRLRKAVLEPLLYLDLGDAIDDARANGHPGERQRHFSRGSEDFEQAETAPRVGRHFDDGNPDGRGHALPPRSRFGSCVRAASAARIFASTPESGLYPSSTRRRSPGSMITSRTLVATTSGAGASAASRPSASISAPSSASLRPYRRSWLSASGRARTCSVLTARSWSRCLCPYLACRPTMTGRSRSPSVV